MARPKTLRQRSRQTLMRVSPAVLLLLVVLLAASVSSLAQGEDPNSEVPTEMPDPTIVSQEVLPNGTLQTQIVIPVTQDTYISSNMPDTNWCGSNWLRLGYDIDEGKGAERIYMWFDVSGIPSNATINWANFQIYQHTITPSGDPNTMGVESRHLGTSWNQCAVTWNGQAPDWGGVIATSFIPNVIGWIQGDVTDLVKQWVSGSHPNYGVILIGDETVQERERGFYSSRDITRYPRLVVEYSTAVDTQPPQVSVNALPQWSPESFTVSWGGTDPGGSGIDYYDVQYQSAGGSWISWLSEVTGTSATFVGANGLTYGFRARGVDRAGNEQAWSSSAQAATTVDNVPPEATVDPLPPYIFEEPFAISWSGTDNLSGIKCFDVQYREQGGDWVQPFTCTTDSSVEVSGAENGKTYELRARATDNAGNVQAWPEAPQAQTTIATGGPVSWILPFAAGITQADQITVQWMGESAPGTSITGYNIRYQYNRGSWIEWLSQTTDTSDVLTNLRNQDGGYCFQAQATDSQARTGDWGGEQCIYVDRNAPFMTSQTFMPILTSGTTTP